MPDPTPARRRPVRRVLTDLVNVDGKLRALSAEQAELQESAEVRALEQEVTALRRAKGAAELAAAEDETKLQRMNQDAAKLRARRRDDIASLGAEVDTERRRDLKHDLAVAERRLAEVEEAIARHDAGTRAAGEPGPGAGPALDRAVAALESTRDRRSARQNEVDGQLTSLREHSVALRAELPDGVRRRYERGDREDGVGAAALVGSSCRACFIELDRASVAEILAAPADDPAACPECGTMLLPEADAYTAHVDRTSGTGGAGRAQ